MVMAKEKDLYKILGVSSNASDEEIKASYKKLVRKYHPDLNKNNKKAEEKFKEVAVAFEVLGDKEKRKIYDEFGLAGLRAGFDADKARAYKQWGGGGFGGGSMGGGGSISDLFEQLFGGGGFGGFGGQSQGGFGGGFGGQQGGFGGFGGFGGQQRPKPQKGSDIESTIQLDFMEALLGIKKKEVKCNIKGKQQTFSVDIPPGISEGARIRLSKQGNPGAHGGPKGDLYLKAKISRHPFYKRDDRDLLLELPLTVSEAYKGGPIDVPTPTGTITLRIPPHSQSGQKLRLRGKGVPGNKKKEAGDFYVILKIVLPKEPSEDLELLLKRVDAMYKANPRADLES